VSCALTRFSALSRFHNDKSLVDLTAAAAAAAATTTTAAAAADDDDGGGDGGAIASFQCKSRIPSSTNSALAVRTIVSV
jgi:hypothetical protein